MTKSLEALSNSLGSIRTGRATPSMLDRIFVNYFSVPTPLKQMASVTVQSGTSLVIEPYDKTAIKDIEK